MTTTKKLTNNMSPQPAWVTLQEHTQQTQRIIKLEEQNKILTQQIQHLTEVTENNHEILTNIRIMQETERAIRKTETEEQQSKITIQIGIISSVCATIIAFLITNLIQII